MGHFEAFVPPLFQWDTLGAVLESPLDFVIRFHLGMIRLNNVGVQVVPSSRNQMVADYTSSAGQEKIHLYVRTFFLPKDAIYGSEINLGKHYGFLYLIRSVK